MIHFDHIENSDGTITNLVKHLCDTCKTQLGACIPDSIPSHWRGTTLCSTCLNKLENLINTINNLK